MKKYIDAEKLKAEIERHIKHYEKLDRDEFKNGELYICQELLSFITSLQQEQPEVNLEKEVKSYIKDNFTITDEVAQIPEEDRRYSMWEDDMRVFARHFYSLGLSARKEK